MLDKALGFRPDAYVPDMEDSVPDDEKQNVRGVIGAHLEKLRASGVRVIPRVNALDTDLIAEDLAAVVGPAIYGISVGKIRASEDIHTVSELIDGLEKKHRMAIGSVKLIPWIETAKAVIHCYKICRASPRIVAVAFGAEDFCHDMGIERSGDDAEPEIEFARNTVCISARATGVVALDTPYFKFRDINGLTRNVMAGKRIGFKGKFAIHPLQIDPINRAFSPSREEIEHARRIVVAYEEAERSGRGSTSLDGLVIDAPVVKRARAVLQLAETMLKPETNEGGAV